MKAHIFIFLSLAAGSAITSIRGADTIAELPPPSKRAEIVARAEQIAQTSIPAQTQSSDSLRNPFVASVFESKDSHANRPTTDKELLLLLADQIQTTGVMGREDSMILLLKGQKGVKVNEKLTVSFDGSTYEVEIIAIDRYNFSLRYNQAEVTRPIKTGKNL